MKKMFALLCLCVLGCSPSGNANQSGQQPNGFAGLLAQAMPQQPQPSQPAATEAEAPPPQRPPVQPFGMQPPPMQAPPQPSMQAPPPPMQTAPPQAPAFEGFEPPEAAPEPPVAAAPMAPAPPAMAPVQPDPSQADGTAEVCSAMCDRVAACQIATKEACMPVCAPQVPQLAPEQRAELIKIMGNMSCDDLSRFGAQGGGTRAGAPEGAEGDDGSDDDGQDSGRSAR